MANLKYFPVGLFASTMGICGLSIAWQRFEHLFYISIGIGVGIIFFAYMVFAGLTIVYSLKIIKYFQDVKEEFKHPVKSNFFPAISISLLLLSIGTLGLCRGAAYYLWIIGTLMHLIFTIIIIHRWIDRPHDIAHANPVWFLPVVGNILVPVAGIGFMNIELAWFFFSVGLFFWLAIFNIIFYRLVFHPQLPDRLMPTLFILIAPPAVGFISYIKITGQVNEFARILFYITLIFVLIVFSMLKKLYKLDFSITWWAYTFPMCVFTLAVLNFSPLQKLPIFNWLAGLLILLISGVVGIALYKTVSAFIRGKVCIPDG